MVCMVLWLWSMPHTGTYGMSPAPDPSCPKKHQGDATCDNIVTIGDYELWRREFHQESATLTADFDANGTITIHDHAIWRHTFFDVNQLTITPTPLTTITPTASPNSTTTPAAPTATPPHTACLYPARILDLTHWYESVPIGSSPLNVKQPELATYAISPWFTVNTTCDGVQFRAPVNGPTTSGSEFARSELREEDGANHASWPSTSGTHTMYIDQAITRVPDSRKRLIAGQIHDGGGFINGIRIDYPRLYVDSGPTLDAAYTLGKRFTVRYVVSGGKIDLYYNGSSTPIFTKDEINPSLYFKAGAYGQSNCNYESTCGTGNYSEVVIYNLRVTHQ